MKRILVVLATAALLLVGVVPAAFAANQPSQGEHSTGRNFSGTAGPHCHVLIVDSAQEQFTIQAFPSHKAHLASGLGHVFDADFTCVPL